MDGNQVIDKNGRYVSVSKEFQGKPSADEIASVIQTAQNHATDPYDPYDVMRISVKRFLNDTHEVQVRLT